MGKDTRFDYILQLFDKDGKLVGQTIEEKNAYSVRPHDIIAGAAKVFPMIVSFSIEGKVVRDA